MASQPLEVMDSLAGAGSLRCHLPPGTRQALRLELRSLELLCISVMVSSFPVKRMVVSETKGFAVTELP